LATCMIARSLFALFSSSFSTAHPMLEEYGERASRWDVIWFQRSPHIRYPGKY
jgi:hypothetical protein